MWSKDHVGKNNEPFRTVAEAICVRDDYLSDLTPGEAP